MSAISAVASATATVATYVAEARAWASQVQSHESGTCFIMAATSTIK
jgi:hypothetical protein